MSQDLFSFQNLLIAKVDEGNKMPLCCISDIESNLTVQGTPYELVQVMLHNGSHYRGLTLLGNQNVLYDGKYCNEFKSIAKTEKFALEGIGRNYRLSCLWYRKVLNKQGLSSYSLPVYPPFTAHDRINEEERCETKTPQHSKEATMEPDTIKEEATCQTKTPTNQKRMSKPKKRYTPSDQSTPKPPKGRSRKKTTREDQSPTIKNTSCFNTLLGSNWDINQKGERNWIHTKMLVL